MPRSFSKAAGRKAMKVTGASRAASGIQVWNGMAPALPMAPTIIRTKAAAASPVGSSETLDRVSVPEIDQTRPMPMIIEKSQKPLMRRALTAVRPEVGLAPMVMRP